MSVHSSQMHIRGDIEMHVDIHGEGDPLVLLHGFTGCGRDFRHFGETLHEGFRAIVPDLPGHGRSGNPRGTFLFRDVARDMYSLLDELGIDRFRALGISGGANVLLHMATQQPSRVEAMVIAAAAPYFPEQARALMRQMTVEGRSEEDWRDMRERHARGDAQIVALWEQGRAFAARHDDMSFTPPHLATITARTLIVYGDRDPLYPVELAVEMYRAIPDAKLWVLPGAGHGAAFEERESFVRVARSFLRTP
ncbi:alpha/beta fold hydrolase [Polyangium fumosum]|uniref:Alpha/beta fold hydrolase n=1 Tax=Polyangium fumosum TaxID=889272 RepID=A0A4V5PP75_9BACT|nr:alpha/beta fold hydrolase [Polyangium fumosum]TKD12402.1 alpha/beta fold hydrolase [Polyangium fumosum]